MLEYAENYSDVLKFRPKKVRDYIRDITLDVLYLKHKKDKEFLLQKPRLQMLYFHHIFKDEEKKFDDLLKKLSKDHFFISYSEAIDRIINNKIDKPYISFSSDDGFKNNLRAGEILNEYGASCCFFINPELIGQTDFKILKQHCNNRLDFPATEMLTWDDVNLLQNRGHEIGSHTMYHMNIIDAWYNDIVEDMYKSREILLTKCGKADHFAFPYGRLIHFNEIGRRAVFNAGFISCATAERGCHVNTTKINDYSQLAIRRDQIIADWKWQHIYYFLINNAKKSDSFNNLYPY